jgi:hypothetical protein
LFAAESLREQFTHVICLLRMAEIPKAAAFSMFVTAWVVRDIPSYLGFVDKGFDD